MSPPGKAPRPSRRPYKGLGAHGASCFESRQASLNGSKRHRHDASTANQRNRSKLLILLVAPSGIEPELSALRGRRVNQLHHGAVWRGSRQIAMRIAARIGALTSPTFQIYQRFARKIPAP